MNCNIEEIIKILEEASKRLRGYGEKYWAERLEKDAALIKDGDSDGITHLLSSYGGMGSFNDLLIHSANGHNIPESETAAVNEWLKQKQSELFSLAKALKRELDI